MRGRVDVVKRERSSGRRLHHIFKAGQGERHGPGKQDHEPCIHGRIVLQYRLSCSLSCFRSS
jgi:hypothetical protein